MHKTESQEWKWFRVTFRSDESFMAHAYAPFEYLTLEDIEIFDSKPLPLPLDQEEKRGEGAVFLLKAKDYSHAEVLVRKFGAGISHHVEAWGAIHRFLGKPGTKEKRLAAATQLAYKVQNL